MTTQSVEEREKKISKAMQALERARALERSRRDFGVDGICHHVKFAQAKPEVTSGLQLLRAVGLP